jgi:hypothetical protein
MISKVLVIRPYIERIRTKMFGHLKSANLTINPDEVIPVSMSDNEIIQELKKRSSRDYVLLIPFNVNTDKQGNVSDGLGLIVRINQEVRSFNKSPILMPVSTSGAVGIRMALKEKRDSGDLPADLDGRILFIGEQDLDKPKLSERIRNHVDKF